MPKRGLITLVVAWSVLLLLPAFQIQTRRMFQSRGENDGAFYAVHTDWAEIAKSQPENGLLALQQLQSQTNRQQAVYWDELDALMSRFPKDLGLRRARLMESARPGKLVFARHSVPDLKENQSAGDNWKVEDLPTDEQRDSIVRATRLGEEQAPNDGFFPWMEAMALWNRDEEAALRALERAARKTDWNDGTMENQRALLKSKNAQTPMGWEEKTSFFYETLFPHYALVRKLTREVTWSGIEHYRRGDKAGAYRLWRAALQASGAFRRSQSRGPNATIIGLLVAEATQKIVWQTVAVELNAPAKTGGSFDNVAANAARLSAFKTLAKRDGYGDLAAYAARENASFEARELSQLVSGSYDILGLNAPAQRTGTELFWVGIRVFWLGVAGALSLLACLVWRARVGGAHWFGASSSQIAFFGPLWGGALSLALWGRVQSQLQLANGFTDNPLAFSAPSSLYNYFDKPWAPWLAIGATLALSIALVYWQSSRETNRLRQQITPRADADTASAWLPKLNATAWILVALSTPFLFLVGEPERVLAFALWTICTVAALALALWRIERGEKLGRARARLALIGAVCALITLGLAAQLGMPSNDNVGYAAMVSFFFTLAILIYLAANSREWRPLFPRAIAIALQTLGGVAAVCAVALLLASLAALPVRARQSRIVDDYIARGEIDWMKSQQIAGRQP